MNQSSQVVLGPLEPSVWPRMMRLCRCAATCGRLFDPQAQLGPYLIVRGSRNVHKIRSDGRTWCGFHNDQSGTPSFAYYVAHAKSFNEPPAAPFALCANCLQAEGRRRNRAAQAEEWDRL
jgi:hypothetical protein